MGQVDANLMCPARARDGTDDRKLPILPNESAFDPEIRRRRRAFGVDGLL